MKKIYLFLNILILASTLNLFGWKVTVQNLSDEPIQIRVGSSQNYPCGHWYGACMDDWCDCGGTVDVPPKQTGVFNYDRSRTCSADYICNGACTTSLSLTNKGNKNISKDILKPVGACSNVNAFVGKKDDGSWYLVATDWTDDLLGSIQDKIEPAIMGGFRFSELIPNALQAAESGGKIGDRIDDFTKEIDRVTKEINNLMGQVNKESSSINDFINKTGVRITDFQAKLPAILKGDFIGTLTLLDQIQKINTTIEDAKQLLEKFKIIYDSLDSQISNLNLRQLITALINLVTTIKNLVGNIKVIIDSIPEGVTSHAIVGPLKNAESDLNKLIEQLNVLKNEKYLTVNEIGTNIVNGVLYNINGIDKLANNTINSVNKIIPDISKITDKIVPNLKAGLNSLTKAVDNIKDKILNEVKKPDNIAEITGIALGALPVTIITFGTLTPAYLLTAMTPMLRRIVNPIFKATRLNDFIGAVKDLVGTIKNDIDLITSILNELKTSNILIFPDNVNNTIIAMGQTAQNLTKDIDDVYNAIPSLTGINNLRITKATYGTSQKNIDVTAALTSRMGSSPNFTGGPNSMNSLFSDPAPGQAKRLTVEYTDENNVKRTKVVNEDESFSLEGTKILKATYGTTEKNKDVTSNLKSAMGNSLNFPGGPNSMNLLFSDPAPGQTKLLTIEYSEDGVKKTKVVNENEPFSLEKTEESRPVLNPDAFKPQPSIKPSEKNKSPGIGGLYP